MVREEWQYNLPPKIRIPFFSFLSFYLRLIIATSPAAEVTSAGPVGHLDVRSQISDILFSRNANRSIVALVHHDAARISNRRPVRPL